MQLMLMRSGKLFSGLFVGLTTDARAWGWRQLFAGSDACLELDTSS